MAAMSQVVRIVPEDLAVSAATVDAYADTVHSRHLAADGRIDAALPGLPPSAATALSRAVSKWQADTTAIFQRMIDHSDDLRAAAAAYQQTDADSSAAINSVDEQLSELDLGL